MSWILCAPPSTRTHHTITKSQSHSPDTVLTRWRSVPSWKVQFPDWFVSCSQSWRKWFPHFTQPLFTLCWRNFRVPSKSLTRLKSMLADASKGRYGRDIAVEIPGMLPDSLSVLKCPPSFWNCNIHGWTPFSHYHNSRHRLPHGKHDSGRNRWFLPVWFSEQATGLCGNVPLYLPIQPAQKLLSHPHMERRGSRYLRYALYNTAKYVCHWDPTFAAYPAKKQAEGKHYDVALPHAAKKSVRLVFALKKSRQLYCPAAWLWSICVIVCKSFGFSILTSFLALWNTIQSDIKNSVPIFLLKRN